MHVIAWKYQQNICRTSPGQLTRRTDADGEADGALCFLSLLTTLFLPSPTLIHLFLPLSQHPDWLR